jgi:hypothetical protein
MPTPVLPPVCNTIEVTGALDLAGTSVEIVAGDPVRVPLNYLVGWRVTVPQLSTAELAAGWTAKVWISRVVSGVRVKLGSVTLAAVSGEPGVFSGNMSRGLAASVGGNAYQYEIGLTEPQGNWTYCVVLPTDVSVLDTGLPLDSPPTVSITSPAANATVLPSSVTVQFSYTGAVVFAAMVDGVVDETIEVTAADGVGSYSVSVASVGAISLGVRATSEFGASTNASRIVTCALPTVTIVSPTEGETFDVQSVTFMLACSPAMPAGTSTRLLVSGEVIATGTLTSGGVSTVLSGELLEGDQSVVAQVDTLAGPASSSPTAISIVDALPEITINSPVSGSTVGAGTIFVDATVTHVYDRPVLARARIDSGNWFDLSITGGHHTGESPSVSADGSHLLLVQSTDALDWSVAGAISSENITFSITYLVGWNNGIQEFSADFRDTSAPTGASVLDLSDAGSGAVDGGVLRVSVPAEATSFGLVLPPGYSQAADAELSWADGSQLDGFVGHIPGAPYVVLLQINTAAQTISISARCSTSNALPNGARLYRMASDTGVDLVGRDRTGGTTSDAAEATGVASVPDANASGGASMGSVLSGTGGSYRVPVAGGNAAYSMMCWCRFPETNMLCFGAPNSNAIYECEIGVAIGGSDTYTARSQPSAFTNPGNVSGKWAHLALVSSQGVCDVLINGELIGSATANTPTSWGSGVRTSPREGCMFLGPTSTSGLQIKNALVAGSSLTREAVLVHAGATAPLPNGGTHVITLGSSYQDQVPTGATYDLSEATRRASGISADHWHHYASNGASVPVVATQARSAFYDWGSRGMIAVCDWGCLINSTQGSTSLSVVREAKSAWVSMFSDLLRLGVRVIMIDMCGCYQPGDPQQGDGTKGELLRIVQNEMYSDLGTSLIRFDAKRVLGQGWNSSETWYDDGIHFNNAAVNLLAPALATLVNTLRNQPIPAATPAWV